MVLLNTKYNSIFVQMFKTIVILFFYVSVGAFSLSAQIKVDIIKEEISLVGNKNVEWLYADINIPFEKIKSEGVWKLYDDTYYSLPERSIWLKFELQNDSRDTVYSYLHCLDDYLEIYQRHHTTFERVKNGAFVPFSERDNQSDYFFTQLTTLPFQKTQVYIKSNTKIYRGQIKEHKLYSEIGYFHFKTVYAKEQKNSIAFIYFYIISLVTIFTFTLIFYLHVQKRLYFYYLGYLFFQLVYGLLVLRYTFAPVGNVFTNFPRFAFIIFDSSQFMFIGFYVLFVIHLLQIKIYDRLLTRALYLLAIICFVYSAFVFSINCLENQIELSIMLQKIIRIIVLPSNFILFIWMIIKIKHPLVVYFIIGQSLFFIGGSLSTYVGFTDVNFLPEFMVNLKKNPNILFQIGLLGEVYCFSIALGQNVLILQKDKDKATLNLIDQLKENQHLQENMNRELDKKVHEKTDELIQLYSEIERDRERKTKDDFTKKIKETEMMALRSQMNPHFIFNSMNAIKSLMMNSRNDDAIIYLDDFSSLLRGILQNSNREKITVEEELEILELYLSLEKSRMGNDFNYKIIVNSKEELSQYEIPPLLLQPIVENAIWHGLHASFKAEKNLTVTFDTTENLKIIIEDNGIGRKESSKNKKLHQSLGTNIVQERLTLFNYLNTNKIKLEITDLEDDFRATGTQIILTYQY